MQDAPDAALLAAFAALAGAGSPLSVAQEADADWLALSQAGLVPVNAGRFHVHTGEQRGQARPGQIAIRIDAGLAFGTGQHATTLGCLLAIDRLRRRQRLGHVLDLGTGSGVLAIAAARADRRAQVMATDVDPVAVAVARANARGNRAGTIRLRTGTGLPVAMLRRQAPFDLVLANILMAPLLALAEGLSHAVRPGGRLVLAGLLSGQRCRIEAAYRARGFRLVSRTRGEWPVLTLVRRGRARRTAPLAAVRAARRGTAAALRSAGSI